MDNKELMESGTLLYLKEHTKEMKRLRYTLITIFIIFALFVIWIIWTGRVAFPVKILRTIATNCKELL